MAGDAGADEDDVALKCQSELFEIVRNGKKVKFGRIGQVEETSMQVISILGNTLVLWTVLAHRRMWSLTNYFLVNLAVADLGMAVFNCIPG